MTTEINVANKTVNGSKLEQTPNHTQHEVL